MSSLDASPSCTLLMIPSSAVRCSVSFKRRFVSSNKRAFSNATLILLTSVLSNRTSESGNASSMSRFCKLITPLTSPLAIIGTITIDFAPSPIITAWSYFGLCWSRSLLMTRGFPVSITCFLNPLSGLRPNNVRSPFS